MGYILPLPHYQYKDYQKRVTEYKQDPFYIEKPYKTILEPKHRDIADEHARLEASSNSIKKLTAPKVPTDEKLYADLTGKGRHFSDTI
ncbi:hypothetical protein [Virgibacillus doumboii]|uniref:hypothetical protein n=1 Tax=Virgibacillus doumboii TaxID=2697503 RepID=UPI0013E02772|nr:hypothetical protein [Virgibacillus doumboii]